MKTLMMIICLFCFAVLKSFGQLNVGFEASTQKVNYVSGIDKQQVKVKIIIKGDAYEPNTILKISENVATSNIPITDFKFLDSPFSTKLFLNLDDYPKKIIEFLVEMKKPAAGSNTLVLDIQLESIYDNILLNAASHPSISLINDSVVPAVIPPVRKRSGMHEDTTNIFRTDFNQYTDILGFSDTAPNGLVQQEFKFKIPINSFHHFYEDEGSFQFLRSLILTFLINRIDKTQEESIIGPFRNTITNPDGTTTITTSPVIGTFDLFRKNSLDIDTRLVIIGYRKKDFKIYLDGRLGLLRNTLEQTSITKDTAKKTVDTLTLKRVLYSTDWGLNLYIQNKFNRFEVIGEGGFRKISLQDSYFKQFDVFDISPFNNNSKVIALLPNNPIWYLSATLKYDLTNDEKKDDFIFIRLQYHWQNALAPSTRPIVSDATLNNHFLQIQAGINLKIPVLSSKFKN